MHKDTSYLRNTMLQYEDISDRLAQLYNSYEGETCYIVSAGPSLKNFEEDYLKDKLKDELVISIKQSVIKDKSIITHDAVDKWLSHNSTVIL